MPNSYLIVDDSPVICHAIRKMLLGHGIEPADVHTVTSGQEALDRFAAVAPDVVFLDVNMPGIDGEMTAKAMMEQDPDAKVVVITGVGMDDQRVRNLRSLGAFELLEKPIHSEDIADILHLIEREESGAGRIA